MFRGAVKGDVGAFHGDNGMGDIFDEEGEFVVDIEVGIGHFLYPFCGAVVKAGGGCGSAVALGDAQTCGEVFGAGGKSHGADFLSMVFRSISRSAVKWMCCLVMVRRYFDGDV